MGIQFKNVLLIVASFFIVVFIMPLFVLFVYLPLSAFRQTVIFLSSYKSDLYLPLNICSCCTAWDDMYSKPRCSLCCILHLKDVHSFVELSSRVEKLLDVHPELTCSLTRWMSIFFWKKCLNFQLSNNITLFEESDPENINQFLNCIPEKPFTKGQPLWEIISIPNHLNVEYASKSTIVIRIHHSLGDGFAILSLIGGLSDEQTPKVFAKPPRKSINALHTVLNLLQLIFITPTEAIYNTLKGFDSNELTVDVNRQTGQMIRVREMNAIDISYVKRISKNARTSITSILYASVAGAIRNVMIEKGWNVTKDMRSLYVIPQPGHPGTALTNYAFPIPVRSPISQSKREQRLAQIHNKFKRFFSPSLMIGQFLMVKFGGILFAVFGKEITVGHFGSYIHTNFAVLGEPFKMFENNVIERIMMTNGLQRSSNSLFVGTVSYNGKFGFMLSADKALFPDEYGLKRIIHFIQDELNELDKMHAPKNV